MDMPRWKNDLALMKAEHYADPNFMPTHIGVGICRSVAGDYKGAIEAYSVAINLIFPNEPTVDAKIAQRDRPEFKRNLQSQSSLRYLPHNYVNTVMRGRGGLYQYIGLYDLAVEDYRVALAYVPDDEEVRAGIRTCLRANGHFEKQ